MNVEFEEDNFKPTPVSGGSFNSQSGSKMTNWLVKSGFAKDASSANMIMTIVAFVIFALSIYVFKYGFNLPFTQAQGPIESQFQGVERLK